MIFYNVCFMFLLFLYIMPYYETSCLTTNRLIINQFQNVYRTTFGYEASSFSSICSNTLDIRNYTNFNLAFVDQLCQPDPLKNPSILNYYRYLREKKLCKMDDLLLNSCFYFGISLIFILMLQLLEIWLLNKNCCLLDNFFSMLSFLKYVYFPLCVFYFIILNFIHFNVCNLI